MKTVSELFFDLASERLSAPPSVKYRWETGLKSQRTLVIPKMDDEGYDIRIGCESYGLYAFADGWHGEPWDQPSPDTTIEETCEQCLGFIRSLLCEDSSLTIYYAGRMPYKWILRYPTSQGMVNDETGLLIYNYLGRKHKITLANRQLPARENTK